MEMIVYGKDRDYVIHDDKNIKGLFGEHRWLSNFHVCDVYFDGLLYRSTEAAYQSAKTTNMHIRQEISELSPSDSMKRGRSFEPRPGWESMKYDVMSVVLFDKFYRNKDLREKLLDTGDKYIEETNHWGDRFYGVCDGKGENNLGRILMNIRTFWQVTKLF